MSDESITLQHLHYQVQALAIRAVEYFMGILVIDDAYYTLQTNWNITCANILYDLTNSSANRLFVFQ